MAWRRVLVLVVLVLAGFGAGAGRASATTKDTITAVSAGSPSTDVGSLRVQVDSTTQITTLTANVDTTGGTLELSPAISETSQTTISSGYQSLWTVTTPIEQGTPPDGLALGSYNVYVDATDSGGTSVSNVYAGQLNFVDQPELTLATTNTTDIDYDNPTATVTGTVGLLEPSGTVAPYEGTVALIPSWGGSFTVSSDAAGDFSATVSPRGTGAYIYATGPIAGNTGMSNQVSFNVVVDPVAITATLSAPTVTYGAKETVSGVATYQPSSGAAYEPLAGQTVSVSGSDPDGNTPVITGVTNASGDYSISLPADINTTWSVQAGSNSYSSLLDLASAGASMDVNLPTVLTGVQVSMNQYWDLSFSGCLSLEENVSDASLYSASRIELQYADSKTGPWHTLTRVSVTGNACGHDGSTFRGTATAAENYAYYRVVYGGAAPTYMTYGYVASSSSPALVWKYYDRITGFGASATVVNHDGKLTVHGSCSTTTTDTTRTRASRSSSSCDPRAAAPGTGS